MTTDNRTNEPTPEQVESAMFQLFPSTVRYDGDDVPNPGAADRREGFLAGVEFVRGISTGNATPDGQVLAALNAYERTVHEQNGIKRPYSSAEDLDDWAGERIAQMRAALVAAARAARGAAPVPSSGVDEERLAEYTRVKQAEAWERNSEETEVGGSCSCCGITEVHRPQNPYRKGESDDQPA